MAPGAIPTKIQNLFQPKRFAIFEACLIGVVSGLAAIVLKTGIRFVGESRLRLATWGAPEYVLPLAGLVGGMIAGVIIQWIAPESSGSGVPYVKAVLARVPLKLDLRVALAKLFGAMVSIGSGIVLGREGPTIQVGSALAAQLSEWFPTSPEYRRQLIAAGASAGLAAAFNTPITGVLFVFEALLQDTSSFSLGTGVLAAFIGAVISRQLGAGEFSLTSVNTSNDIHFLVQEIPVYIFLGALTGAIGALFNRGLLFSGRIFRRGVRVSIPMRLGIAGLLCGGIIASLPPTFWDNAGLRARLLDGNTDPFFPILVFLEYIGLTLVAYGSGSPGGLSAPSLVLGTSLGLIVGEAADFFWGIDNPKIFALAGGGGFFCGVARTPVSAVIIIFELLGNFEIVLPLMIVSVVSYFVAERIHSGSIYEHILRANGIVVEQKAASVTDLTALKAVDVMQRRVETLTATMTLAETIEAFSASHHRGFPVLAEGKLVGIVTQTDLAAATAKKLEGTTLLNTIMTPNPITIHPDAKLSEVLYLLNRYQLSRLPVLENRILIGIITRSDIIRAESDRLSGKVTGSSDPSYVVYQTRGPATGKGRMLVLLNNPKTAAALMQIATSIAQSHGYEIECLHVITISRTRAPSEVSVISTRGRRLLRQAQQIVKKLPISIHTQVRVAHDTAQAVLETIRDRQISLTLMGWRGQDFTPGRVFGNVVDTLIRQASGHVMVVRLEKNYAMVEKWDRWLVPVAGGPNAQIAIQEFLPALTSLGKNPEISLCQVFLEGKPVANTEVIQADAHFLKTKLQCPVRIDTLIAPSVPGAIVELAHKQQTDAIVLGATRESFLQQVVKGNIPETIARESPCTVILVRAALA